MQDPYAFVSTQCRQWIEEYGNSEPFDRARREHPGQWVVVHDLRPLEFLGFLIGLNRPYRPVQVIRWDDDAQVFISRPYQQLKYRVRRNLPMGPQAWWRAFAVSQIPTFTGLWWRLEHVFVQASERLDGWLHGTERRPSHGRPS